MSANAPSICPAWTASFREWFGLPRSQARMLAVLYRAAGAPLAPWELSQASGTAEGAVRSHVYQLRRALRAEALDREHGRGYRLTEVGQAECESALEAMASEFGDG